MVNAPPKKGPATEATANAHLRSEITSGRDLSLTMVHPMMKQSVWSPLPPIPATTLPAISMFIKFASVDTSDPNSAATESMIVPTISTSSAVMKSVSVSEARHAASLRSLGFFAFLS